MGSMENPKTWVPYMINTKDCSQGFCSLYCPQWCYMIFPPPPPFEFPNEHKDSKISPLIVAVIGILASAFLLVSYYAIISKYCKNRDEDSSREREDQNPNDESQGNQDSPINELSQGANNGLDEAMIKSITVFKFKKEKGFNESTESCSVCLSEFQENESLRLLPKCCHAFHKMCIDTWLKSHSNCPLCRANIVFANSLTPQLSPSAIELPTLQESASQSTPVIYNVALEEEHDIEMGIQEMNLNPDNQVEIPGNLYKSNEGEPIRRSLSMNDCVSLSHGHLSIADVLHINQDEDEAQMVDQWPNWDGSEASKRCRVANGVVNCDAGVRRSVSSSRFVLSNGVNGRNITSIHL